MSSDSQEYSVNDIIEVTSTIGELVYGVMQETRLPVSVPSMSVEEIQGRPVSKTVMADYNPSGNPELLDVSVKKGSTVLGM